MSKESLTARRPGGAVHRLVLFKLSLAEGRFRVELEHYFEYLTVGMYWALIVTWALIVSVYIYEYRRIKGFSPLLKTLLIVLFIDAGRTLFESLYFGCWYTAKAGFITPHLYAVLSRPELFIIPKTMNLIGAAVILTVLCRRWIHDMLAETKRQQEIQRLKAFQEAAFNAITDPVALLDPDYRLLMANEATARLYGLRRDQVVGGKCSALLHNSPDLCEACPVAVAMETGEPAYAEVRAESINEILATWAYPLKDHTGHVYGVLKYAKVVTQEKKLEERQREVEQFRRELIALASHELKAPLTSIRGYAEMLTRESEQLTPHELGEFVQIIHHESRRLETLVNDLLDMSLVDEGKLRLDPGPCLLPPVCEEARRVALGAGGKHTIRLGAPDELPPVQADPGRVRQVLVNLLSNAVKYSPDGGDIVLEVEPRGDRVRIVVSDKGVGIPPEAQERLFTRFYRVETPETQQIEGTGLGLYLCKAIVEGYKGRIWVESEVGQGSSFFVELPIAAAPPTPSGSTEES